MSYSNTDRNLFKLQSKEILTKKGKKAGVDIAVHTMIQKLDVKKHFLLIDTILDTIGGPEGLQTPNGVIETRAFRERLEDLFKLEEQKAEDFGKEAGAQPLIQSGASTKKLYAYVCRNIETCCAAAIREPRGNVMDTPLTKGCTHFLRQCRRKPAVKGEGCVAIPSEHLFCRQHLCFPPQFVYTNNVNDDPYPRRMIDVSVPVDGWCGQSKDGVGPVGGMTGNFLQHLDNIFRYSKLDITAIEKTNKHKLGRFKQDVIENVKINIDLLVQHAQDSVEGDTHSDQDAESELCEYVADE